MKKILELFFIIPLCLIVLKTLAAEQEGHMHEMPAGWTDPIEIVMVAYPGFTALDLAGPQYMFASIMGAKVHIAAATLDPVPSDTGLTIVPTTTFDQIPSKIDLLFVPGGGLGTIDAIANKELIDFVKDRGERARYVTSVCTGSLVLGAAGLLDGYQATSHWLTLDLLPEMGAIPVSERVVIDRNRITGGGVTAGIDFGLQIVAQLRDKHYAESLQLLAEYDPQPPFNSGSPDTASEASVQLIKGMFAGYNNKARNALEQLADTP